MRPRGSPDASFLASGAATTMATDSSGRFAETRFGMHASADAIAGATLVVSIFDHDRIATSREPLGEVTRKGGNRSWNKRPRMVPRECYRRRASSARPHCQSHSHPSLQPWMAKKKTGRFETNRDLAKSAPVTPCECWAEHGAPELPDTTPHAADTPPPVGPCYRRNFISCRPILR